jgi:protein-S-isoprenylcysteine O-methyltransferase Ste14
MNGSYFLFLSLFIASLVIRSSYEVLKKSGKVNPESKPLFAAVFTAMCLMWISWFGMCPLDPFPIALPDQVRWTGFVLVVVGSVLAVGGLVQLRGVENIDRLVTTGLFSKLRHPMYTGFLCWIVGWSTCQSALASAAVGLLGIGNILYWRRLEENALELSYGEIYRVYRERTWF